MLVPLLPTDIFFVFIGMASQNLRDKKLKGQLTGKEKLIGLSAKAAVQAEKVRRAGFVAIYTRPDDTPRVATGNTLDSLGKLKSKKVQIALPTLPWNPSII